MSDEGQAIEARAGERRPIEVRDARPAEYEAVGKIVAEAFFADGQLDAPGSEFYADVLRDVASRADAAEIIAVLDDGVVVGGVTFVPHGGPMADIARGGEAEIRMLGVAPDAQGRGAGTALMRECLARAGGRGPQVPPPGRGGWCSPPRPSPTARTGSTSGSGSCASPAGTGRPCLVWTCSSTSWSCSYVPGL